MPNSSVPLTRRELNFSDHDAVLADARRLLTMGYARGGNWDLSQIARHLAGALHGSIDGGAELAPLPIRIVARLFVKRAILRSRKLRSGLPVPKGLVFESSGDDAAAVDQLAAAITRFQSHPGPCGNHPFFGRLTREEWHQFHLIHAGHHLSFLVPVPTR